MRLEEQISVKLLSDITNVFFLTLFLFQIIIVCSDCWRTNVPWICFRVLKSKSNKNVICIVTSIVFSFFHFNEAVSISLFVFSMYLNKAYESKSDISDPIVMHQLFNDVGLEVVKYLPVDSSITLIGNFGSGKTTFVKRIGSWVLCYSGRKQPIF